METVLIEGAGGGVGGYAVQIAELRGATVIAAASTPNRRDAALALGADHVVDYTARGWTEQVRKITGGRGVDVVLEIAGGDAFGQANLGIWSGLRPAVAVAALRTLIGHVAAGQITIKIGHVLPLAHAAAAHRLIENRESTGKVILKPWPDA